MTLEEAKGRDGGGHGRSKSEVKGHIAGRKARSGSEWRKVSTCFVVLRLRFGSFGLCMSVGGNERCERGMNTKLRMGQGINNICGIRGFSRYWALITRGKREKIPSGHVDATKEQQKAKRGR